jgi:hypothetical protein
MCRHESAFRPAARRETDKLFHHGLEKKSRGNLLASTLYKFNYIPRNMHNFLLVCSEKYLFSLFRYTCKDRKDQGSNFQVSYRNYFCVYVTKTKCSLNKFPLQYSINRNSPSIFPAPSHSWFMTKKDRMYTSTQSIDKCNNWLNKIKQDLERMGEIWVNREENNRNVWREVSKRCVVFFKQECVCKRRVWYPVHYFQYM